LFFAPADRNARARERYCSFLLFLRRFGNMLPLSA
jgi:hypothetical protein